MKKGLFVILAVFTITLIFTACSTPAVSTGNSGSADGKALVSQKCSECHSADVVMGKKLTESQWSDLVLRMVGHGLKVTDSEKAAIITYLSETYK